MVTAYSDIIKVINLSSGKSLDWTFILKKIMCLCKLWLLQKAIESIVTQLKEWNYKLYLIYSNGQSLSFLIFIIWLYLAESGMTCLLGGLSSSISALSSYSKKKQKISAYTAWLITW